MRIALWGAGKLLPYVIDQIDKERHVVTYILDSDNTKSGQEQWGIPIRYYKELDNSIDAVVITTVHFEEILEVIEKEFPDLGIPVFQDMDHFLAYEYVNISHSTIAGNPLYEFLKKNQFQCQTDKSLQYLETYHEYFSKYRNKKVVFMEIGIFHGGSLKMWKDYFGEQCKIIGVDINEECKKYKEDQVEIEIGSQDNKYFWDYIKEKYPHIDIILDDGGHTMKQQIFTFSELFPSLAPDGVYMCEDVYTSYWPVWGGSWKNESTFIEYCKNLIDHMNINFAPKDCTDLGGYYCDSTYVKNIKSVNFHQGIVVIKKDKNVIKRLDNRWLR